MRIVRVVWLVSLCVSLIATIPQEAVAQRSAPVFVVFFDLNSGSIRPDAEAIIRKAVDAWNRTVRGGIKVIGYTDRSLPSEESEQLSKARATNVALALNARLVPQSRIFADARGENDPRVPTGPGIREPQNERVEIIILSEAETRETAAEWAQALAATASPQAVPPPDLRALPAAPGLSPDRTITKLRTSRPDLIHGSGSGPQPTGTGPAYGTRRVGPGPGDTVSTPPTPDTTTQIAQAEVGSALDECADTIRSYHRLSIIRQVGAGSLYFQSHQKAPAGNYLRYKFTGFSGADEAICYSREKQPGKLQAIEIRNSDGDGIACYWEDQHKWWQDRCFWTVDKPLMATDTTDESMNKKLALWRQQREIGPKIVPPRDGPPVQSNPTESLDLGNGWSIGFDKSYTPDLRNKIRACAEPVYRSFWTARGDEISRLSMAKMPADMQIGYMNEFTKQWRDTYIMPAIKQCERKLQN